MQTIALRVGVVLGCCAPCCGWRRRVLFVDLDEQMHSICPLHAQSASELLRDFLREEEQREQLDLGAVFVGAVFERSPTGVCERVRLPRVLLTAAPVCVARSWRRRAALVNALSRACTSRVVLDATHVIDEVPSHTLVRLDAMLAAADPNRVHVLLPTPGRLRSYVAVQCSLLARSQLAHTRRCAGAAMLLDPCRAIVCTRSCTLALFADTAPKTVAHALAVRAGERRDDQCIVCLEELGRDLMTTTTCPCLLTMHERCAREWFSHSCRCPVCRRFLMV